MTDINKDVVEAVAKAIYDGWRCREVGCILPWDDADDEERACRREDARIAIKAHIDAMSLRSFVPVSDGVVEVIGRLKAELETLRSALAEISGIPAMSVVTMDHISVIKDKMATYKESAQNLLDERNEALHDSGRREFALIKRAEAAEARLAEADALISTHMNAIDANPPDQWPEGSHIAQAVERHARRARDVTDAVIVAKEIRDYFAIGVNPNTMLNAVGWMDKIIVALMASGRSGGNEKDRALKEGLGNG